jgi:hypothetical protein
MYRLPAVGDLLSQGDIFRRRFVFPFLDGINEDFQVARGDTTSPHTQIPDAWAAGTEAVLLSSHSTELAIVLSNSCDAENDEGKDSLEFVLVGAILPLSFIPEADNRRNCQRNKMYRYHHLEAAPQAGLPESYVHFGLVALVDQVELAQSKQARILSLESPYRESLGHRIGEFLSRVALP